DLAGIAVDEPIEEVDQPVERNGKDNCRRSVFDEEINAHSTSPAQRSKPSLEKPRPDGEDPPLEVVVPEPVAEVETDILAHDLRHPGNLRLADLVDELGVVEIVFVPDIVLQAAARSAERMAQHQAHIRIVEGFVEGDVGVARFGRTLVRIADPALE